MEEQQKHIEDYLFGRLSNQEKSDFEQAMGNDSALAKEVESIRLSKEISNDFLELELRGILDKEEAGVKNQSSEVKQNLSKLWWIVGGIIGLVFLGYIAKNAITANEEKPTYANLYTEPAWPLSRSGESDILQEGISTALNSDFRAGVDQIYRSTLEPNSKYYWLAELFANEEMADSSLHYTLLIDNPTYKRDRVTYLKVLAHKHLGEDEQVRLLLESIPDDIDSWYLEKYKNL